MIDFLLFESCDRIMNRWFGIEESKIFENGRAVQELKKIFFGKKVQNSFSFHARRSSKMHRNLHNNLNQIQSGFRINQIVALSWFYRES